MKCYYNKSCFICGANLETNSLPDGEWIDAFVLTDDGTKAIGVFLCLGCAGSNPHTTCGCCDEKIIEALQLGQDYFDNKCDPAI